MNNASTDSDQDDGPQRDSLTAFLARIAAALAVSFILTWVLVTAGLVEPAAAQANNSTCVNATNVTDCNGYYANVTPTVQNQTWMEGHQDPTLHNTTGFLTRIGTFIIGSGPSAPGAQGATGSLVMGLVVFGSIVYASSGSRTGFVGGGVIAITVIVGLYSANLAPLWVYAVALMLIALVGAIAIKRVFR